MITIERAIEIARTRNQKYDAYQEYADAYEFFISGNEIQYGGSDNSIIIEKAGGKILRWSEYFMDVKRNIVEIGDSVKI